VRSFKVVCPKCFKGQQLVGDVPPAGVSHVCNFCRTTFKVKPPAAAAADNLPTPREAMPRPGDLPVDRDAMPKPGDLPVAREAVPRPGDLPVARETMPRPGDLPVAREAVPRPGDLPVAREAMPRPGDLPVAKGPSPSPESQASPPGYGPAKTPPLGLGLDLFSDMDLGAGDRAGAPNDPLDLAAPPLPSSPPANPFAFSLDAPALPESPGQGAPLPQRGPPVLSTRAGAESPPRPRAKTMPFPMPAVAAAPPSTPRPGTSSLSDLLEDELPSETDASLVQPSAAKPNPSSLSNLIEDELPHRPVGATGASSSPLPVARIKPEKRTAPASQLDLGFSLELEGETLPSPTPGKDAIPFPGARVANEAGTEAAPPPPDEEALPSLAPPMARSPSALRAQRPSAKRETLPRWIFLAGGAGAATALAIFVLLPLLRAAPKPEVVIAGLQAELAKDSLPAYAGAADRLIEAATKARERGDRLRLKAAELLLLADTVHGGNPADLQRAEQLLGVVQTQPKLAAAIGVVRALLAVAKNKPREADALLADREAEASLLVLGIARIREGKETAAVAPLRGYVASRPVEALGHYLLAKALAATEPAGARKELEVVLAKNPAHPGARIGLAGLEDTPEKRLAALRALADPKLTLAGTSEQAELQLRIGQSWLALGRSLEAIDAFKRAQSLDKHLTSASLALGEALLWEGKYAQALENLKAAGPALQASAAGKFSLGGALIANGKVTEGLALVEAAAKERREDPRAPFWSGFASVTKQPPDLAGGERGYREAVKRDPKFLPASLKLAALLQQQGKAEESLAVLRAAEEAGAPAPVLQLAWGDALIVAGQPVQAEEVFARAAEADPQSAAARLGIASALEAQGKLAEAKASLEATLKQSPDVLGLRERLAHVHLKLGEKDEALAYFQGELQAGQATQALHLAVARLALDLGRLDLAQSEVKKVTRDSPRNPEALFLSARVHEARNQPGAALQEYRRATTWGNTPEYALAYGRLLLKIGKDNDARKVLSDASGLFEGRMERGRLFMRSGDWANALLDFQTAGKMMPNQADPLILQGLCLDRMGQTAKAEESWRAALKIDGDSAEPHYRIGRLDMDRAKPALAVDHFRKAAAKAPENAPWRADLEFQLAQAELLTGAKSAALAAFKRFLAIAPADAPTRHEAVSQVARLGGGKKK